MTFDPLAHVRVDIEAPPSDGDNLFPSPHGMIHGVATSAGFHVPPSRYGEVEGQADFGDGSPCFYFGRPGLNGPAGMTYVECHTVRLPAREGLYWSFSLNMLEIPVGHQVQVIPQHYDSQGNLLLNDSITVIDQTGVYYRTGSQVVANAHSMAIVLRFMTDSSTLPNFGVGCRFRSVYFAMDETLPPATAGATFTNLITKPRFNQAGVGSWFVTQPNTTVERYQASSGYWGRVVKTDHAQNERLYVHTPLLAVTQNTHYSLAHTINRRDGEGLTGARVLWYDAAETLLREDVQYSPYLNKFTNWQARYEFDSPANAAKARVSLFSNGSGSTGWGGFHFRDVSFAASSGTFVSFFDGATPDTLEFDYAWTGAVEASTSTKTTLQAPRYQDPEDRFFEVTGAVRQVTVERFASDVGTVEIVSNDRSLDPSDAASLVRPGRRVRVLAFEESANGYVYLANNFRIDAAPTTFDPLEEARRDGPGLSVTIRARDSWHDLQATPAPYLTPELSTGMQMCDWANVPYWGRAEYAQAGTGYIGVPTDGATVADAMIIARDSDMTARLADPANDYANVFRINRYGIAEYGFIKPSAGGQYLITESAIVADPRPAVSFDFERVRNAVTISKRVQGDDAREDSAQTIEFGPFEDGGSIREWGRRPATLDIVTSPDESLFYSIEDVAENFLALAAQPFRTLDEVTINNVKIGHTAYGILDVYQSLHFDNVAGFTGAVRIDSIKHVLSPVRRHGGFGEWMTTWGLVPLSPPPSAGASGGGAAPATGGSKPILPFRRARAAAYHANGTAVNNWTKLTGFATAFPGMDATFLNDPGTSQPCVDYGSGNLTANTDVWITATLSVQWDTNTTGRRGLRIAYDDSDVSTAEASVLHGAAPSGGTRQTITYNGPLAAGHYLGLWAFQDTGANRTTVRRVLTYDAWPIYL